MKSISLYIDNGTWLTRLHPFTKLLYIVTVIAASILSGNLWIYGLCIGISMILLASGKVLRRAFPLIAFSFTILITIFIIQGLFYQSNTQIIWTIGIFKFYREGIFYALQIGLNIFNMLLSFSILVLTTRPSELVEYLEKAGCSTKFGYIINSVFQIIPQMMGTVGTITDAQRSRGMETEGRLLVRIKAFIPLISPVVSSSLINTRERAIALEIRGFGCGEKKSYLEREAPLKISGLCNVILAVCLVCAVVWRIYLCLR